MSVADQVEEQARLEHLNMLIEDFEREPTIQDVGIWLVNYPLHPLPPRLVRALSDWLKDLNALTVKQSRRGRPHSDNRDVYPLIDGMCNDTGISVEAACHLVVDNLTLDIDSADLRRMYDRARHPKTRLLADLVRAHSSGENGRPSVAAGLKAAQRYKRSAAKKQTQKRQNRTQKP